MDSDNATFDGTFTAFGLLTDFVTEAFPEIKQLTVHQADTVHKHAALIAKRLLTPGFGRFVYKERGTEPEDDQRILLQWAQSLVDEWKLEVTEAAALFSNGGYPHGRGPVDATFSPKSIQRIKILHEIQECIEGDHVTWVRSWNTAFNRTPLSLMMLFSNSGMERVLDHLRAITV